MLLGASSIVFSWVRGVWRFTILDCFGVTRFGVPTLFLRHDLRPFPLFLGIFPILDLIRCYCRSGGFPYCSHRTERSIMLSSGGDPHA